jgi:CYTH domain-containing protein
VREVPEGLERCRSEEIEQGYLGGKLDGLTTAEVEFESREQSDGFHPPPWLGVDVTEDEQFANQALARAAGPPEAGR